MGKRKIRLPGMIFAVLGAIFLIKAAVFLGEDHFARGKMLLAGTWEGVEKQAIRTFLPQVFYDPEADQAFIEELKDKSDKTILIKTLDYHHNDQEFADECVKTLLDIISKKKER